MSFIGSIISKLMIYELRVKWKTRSRGLDEIHTDFDNCSIKNQFWNHLQRPRSDLHGIHWFFNWKSIKEWAPGPESDLFQTWWFVLFQFRINERMSHRSLDQIWIWWSFSWESLEALGAEARIRSIINSKIFQSRINRRLGSRGLDQIHIKFDGFSTQNQLKNEPQPPGSDLYKIWRLLHYESIEEWAPQDITCYEFQLKQINWSVSSGGPDRIHIKCDGLSTQNQLRKELQRLGSGLY